jgi:phosphoglycerate dehydrogenase-like enzyme
MKVVMMGNLVAGYVDDFKDQLTTPWSVSYVGDDGGGLAEALADADAAVVIGWSKSTPPAPKLRLLQVGGAGTDGIDFGSVPPQATVCNAFGHEHAMGEYALMTMLIWCHRFHELSRVLDKGYLTQAERAGLVHHDEIAGKTVGIVGLGRIGIAIAERARALGARIIGTNRTPKAKPAAVDVVIPWEGRGRVFAEADFVCLTTALGPETRGLVDAGMLARMKPTGVLLNVARGAVVDEDALYAALSEKRIGGAIIDVWWSYPSAQTPEAPLSRHPFHKLPNVLTTPHASGWTTGMRRRRAGQFAQNLDRLARGEPLQNIVKPPSAQT